MALINGLTLKQEKFCQEYVKNGGNGSAAVAEVYDPTPAGTTRSIAAENLTKPNVVNRLHVLLNQSGLGLDSLCRDLQDKKNNAERPLLVDNKVVYVKDDGLRLDAIKTALKLHGVLDRDNASTSVTVNVSTPTDGIINALMDKLDVVGRKIGMIVEDGEIVGR